MAKKNISPQFWRCMVKVRQIMGEDLTDSELNELAKKLMAKANRIRAERYGMTADEAVNKALKDGMEEELKASQLAKRNHYLGLKAFNQEVANIKANWADSPREGLMAAMVGSNIARRGAQRSVDADQKALGNEWLSGFAGDVERLGKGKAKMYAGGDLDQDVYRALHEMYKDNPNYRDIDRDAREFAEIVFKWQESTRVHANNAGAWITKIPDYITHQSHDAFSVRSAYRKVNGTRALADFKNYDPDTNFAAWRDHVMQRLDVERTFAGMPEAEREPWLRKVWLAIAANEHLRSTETSNNGFKAPGSLAGRMSERRLLHFRDAQARFEYDQMFGRAGSIFERVALQLYHAGHNVGLMRRFGPNPELTYNRLKEQARRLTEESPIARDASHWHRDEEMLDAFFEEITGVAHLPGQSPISTALRSVRLVQMLSKLGGATVSSIVDIAVASSELNYQGIRGMDNWRAQLDAVFKGYGKRGMKRAEFYEMASELGVAVDLLRSATWSRFAAEDALPGWAARAQHTFFKYNMLMWWTDTSRLSMAQTMSHRLGLNASRTLPELSTELQRMFKLFDITADEWDLMRSRSVKAVDGKEFFSPKGADKITDVELAHLVHKEGKKPTTRALAERREMIKQKFQDYFSARSDYAVITPGPRSRRFMTGRNLGAKPGHTGAEIMRSLSQFKGFPAALIEKVWGREIYGHGESGRMSDITSSGVMGLVRFMAYSTFLGFVVLYLKAYLSGKRLKEPEDTRDYAKLLGAAFVQGGGAGIYGDFLMGHAKDRYGQSAMETLMGPSFGLASRGFSLFTRAAEGKLDGEALASEAFFTTKSNMPYINLFYTRLAIDYLFLYRLQELAAPGSLKRTERSVLENMQQTFALPPSTNYRAEDLTTEDLTRLLNPLE